jgi:hypothetical protein
MAAAPMAAAHVAAAPMAAAVTPVDQDGCFVFEFKSRRGYRRLSWLRPCQRENGKSERDCWK